MDINRPARYLEGKTLDDDWIVKKRITKDNEFGRGSFSESYIVERDGQIALLKALDFSIALNDDDPTQALIELSKTYEFEKQLLELCKSERLSKVVNIIDSGKVRAIEGSVIPAPYFILEYAEKDVKSQVEFDTRLNLAWTLRVLHHTCVGIWQLHKYQIAHRDIKAETVLEFDKELFKITELGNADIKGGGRSLRASVENDVDFFNATPEELYGYKLADWIYSSQARDVYSLGNLAFFLFTQTSFTTWFHFFLDESHQWQNWGGTYEEALPYLVESFDKSVYFFTAYVEDEELRDELEIVLRHLCHPDPKRRGHPKNIASIGSSLSVERFISSFDRLARKASMKV